MSVEVEPTSSHDHADNAEAKRVLHEELDRLPASYRMPLILHYFGGLGREEMAKQLKVKPSTLGVRLHRAREQLRKRMSRRGFALPAVAVSALLAETIRGGVCEAVLAKSTILAGSTLTASLTASSIGASSATLASSANVLSILQTVTSFTIASKARFALIALALSGVSVGLANVQKLIPEVIRQLLPELRAPSIVPRLQAPPILLTRMESLPAEPERASGPAFSGTRLVMSPLIAMPEVASTASIEGGQSATENNGETDASPDWLEKIASMRSSSSPGPRANVTMTRVDEIAHANGAATASTRAEHRQGPTGSIPTASMASGSRSSGASGVSGGGGAVERNHQRPATTVASRHVPTGPDATLRLGPVAGKPTPASPVPTTPAKPIEKEPLLPLMPENRPAEVVASRRGSASINANPDLPDSAIGDIASRPDDAGDVSSLDGRVSNAVTPPGNSTKPARARGNPDSIQAASNPDRSTTPATRTRLSWSSPTIAPAIDNQSTSALSEQSSLEPVNEVANFIGFAQSPDTLTQTPMESIVDLSSDLSQLPELTSSDPSLGVSSIAGAEPALRFERPTGVNGATVRLMNKLGDAQAQIAFIDPSALDDDQAPPLPLGHTFVGVWSLDANGTFEEASIGVQYDERLVSELGLSERVLKLWVSDGTSWTSLLGDPSFSRDTLANLVSGSADKDVRLFAVSAPEPALLTALASAGVLLLRRRAR